MYSWQAPGPPWRTTSGVRRGFEERGPMVLYHVLQGFSRPGTWKGIVPSFVSCEAILEKWLSLSSIFEKQLMRRYSRELGWRHKTTGHYGKLIASWHTSPCLINIRISQGIRFCAIFSIETKAQRQRQVLAVLLVLHGYRFWYGSPKSLSVGHWGS